MQAALKSKIVALMATLENLIKVGQKIMKVQIRIVKNRTKMNKWILMVSKKRK